MGRTIEGFKTLSKEEGLITALESAHAIAHVVKIAPKMDKDQWKDFCKKVSEMGVWVKLCEYRLVNWANRNYPCRLFKHRKPNISIYIYNLG